MYKVALVPYRNALLQATRAISVLSQITWLECMACASSYRRLQLMIIPIGHLSGDVISSLSIYSAWALSTSSGTCTSVRKIKTNVSILDEVKVLGALVVKCCSRQQEGQLSRCWRKDDERVAGWGLVVYNNANMQQHLNWSTYEMQHARIKTITSDSHCL